MYLWLWWIHPSRPPAERSSSSTCPPQCCTFPPLSRGSGPPQLLQPQGFVFPALQQLHQHVGWAWGASLSTGPPAKGQATVFRQSSYRWTHRWWSTGQLSPNLLMFNNSNNLVFVRKPSVIYRHHILLHTCDTLTKVMAHRTEQMLHWCYICHTYTNNTQFFKQQFIRKHFSFSCSIATKVFFILEVALLLGFAFLHLYLLQHLGAGICIAFTACLFISSYIVSTAQGKCNNTILNVCVNVC